jgi:hypothetical protein
MNKAYTNIYLIPSYTDILEVNEPTETLEEWDFKWVEWDIRGKLISLGLQD